MKYLLLSILFALGTTPALADDGDVHAKINIVGGNLVVMNADTWTWRDATIKLNSGVFSGGYVASFGRLAPGKSVAIPLHEFTTSSGERFNIMNRKVMDVLISVHDEKGGFHNNVYTFR
jgi:hypothetical protein